MSSETPSIAPAEWPTLDRLERRVLGVLVEKAKTTPDAYPLSVNALVTGCNQKSNRDPLMDVSDLDAEETLERLKKRGWAIQITGGRVVRWRHALYEAWQVGKVELAVLGELLLRGPQTEGELRGRASRMEPIDDLDALRSVLKRLAERRLVVSLSPECRRGSVVTHGFHDATELERLRGRTHLVTQDEPEPRPMPPDETQSEIASLRRALAELQAAVVDLTEQVRAIKEGLGM